MRIPCRIIQSRHGIYYFRYQFSHSGQRKECRISLKTKSPQIAKEKSLLFSAIILKRKLDLSMEHNEKDILKQHLARINELEDEARALEIVYQSPTGTSITMKADPNVPGDIDAMLKASEAFWQSELGQSMKMMMDASDAEKAKAANPVQPVPQSAPFVGGGATIPELIERLATRKKETLTEKTLYEYRNYQEIFQKWITQRKGTDAFPVRLIKRKDIADFADDLLAKGIKPQTIQQKYLSALNGIFELAKSSGSFPEGVEIPSRGHKLFTKKDAKKTQEKRSWRPFNNQDLKLIFNPATYMVQENPADYWLPLLGLHTGGRISELCQLMVQDVFQEDGIWAISITDEDECQRLKTVAAKRTIPIHPNLIKLGFIEFVEDMKQFGTMLFPYLTPNRFSNFSETPSERYGKYLTKIGLTDPRKVFHSFRSTSNNHLKQNGVPEETRCQFVGHEHETTNSSVYGEKHSVKYLLENVAVKLSFDLPFDELHYPREKIIKTTHQKLKVKLSLQKHREALAKRLNKSS